jgi:hydrogenase 3 maturation protease
MSEATGLAQELRRRLKGKVLLIGVGNTLRGDDGAGPALIALLEGKVKAGLIDVGEAPENYAGKIIAADPDTIVLIDAADFGAQPGDIAVLDPDEISGCGISTHQMPLNVFFSYIRQNCRADALGLGIQPAQIGFGDPVSPAVASSVEALASLLQDVMPLSGEDVQVNDE